MGKIKRKNSESNLTSDDGCITFIITVIALFAPTFWVWLDMVINFGLGGDSIHTSAHKLGSNLGLLLPVIGILSAAIISWLVVSVWKARDRFHAILLSIIITCIVLFSFVEFIAYLMRNTSLMT
jgi:hypothetical protein